MRLILVCLLIFPAALVAQMEMQMVSLTIPKNLKENANAVVRKNDIVVQIKAVDQVVVTTDRIVSVFGDTGMNYIDAYEHYSDSRQIKDMKAVIYDALGNEITTVKERDFRDASAVSGGTLYADDRVKYLEYTARSYPITIHFTSKVIYKSTAFLPQFKPIENFYCSTESSSFKIINDAGIPVKYKETNLKKFGLEKVAELEYAAKNLPALKHEAYRPDFKKLVPNVKFAMKEFVMEGVKGVNNEWSDFGNWMYTDLLSDTKELPNDVKAEIGQLTEGASSDIEKARIVYQYVQDRSRYISVQVGIGGWKPIAAGEVHKMAYGDCKGLTNYTMALLDHVGVTSHYAGIYGGSSKQSMDTDFSMAEGNHAILYLPQLDGGKDYWLECTSKNAPFGFMGDFTDDRDALVVTPQGGKILHTTSYSDHDNLQTTTGSFIISKDGSLRGEINLVTKGVQYSWRNDLGYKSNSDLKKSYLDFWDHLNGLSILSANTVNDKLTPKFTEEVELKIPSYAATTGNLLLFQPNILNRNSKELPVYEDRQFDIEIERGYTDEDNYDIVLEDGLTVDALPDPVKIESKFGNYSLAFEQTDEKTITVNRKVEMFEGLFDKSEYNNFREFRSMIVRSDASRAVLQIKN